MKNIKPAVLEALESNSALISLLGGNRIYQIAVPKNKANEFPRIVFFELNNYDDGWVDDKADTSTISIQVDVFSKENTSSIAKEVDKTMKSLNFKRNSAPDFYEQDTKIYHKAMRYETQVELEDDE